MDLHPLIDSIAEKGESVMRERGTFVDEHGIERCSVCRDPVYTFIDGMGKLPIRCACDDREDEAFRRRKAEQKAQRKVRESPLYNADYSTFTFDRDDKPQSEAATISRAYVEHFAEMSEQNSGLLYTGTVGTGKSFYAACVYNEIIKRGTPALMFTSPALIGAIKREGNGLVRELNAYPLIVLDDLGAERNTDYAAELLNLFVDARYTARKPLVITTNLSAKDMQSCTDMRYRRIFDRIRTMCPTVVILDGESRRAEQQRQKAQQAREIMGI